MLRTCKQRAAALLLLSLCAAALGAARAYECDGKYKGSGRPLLFGGMGESGRCLHGCQPRDDYWGTLCAFNGNSGWGVCSDEQAKNALKVARGVDGGEALGLSPCDLLPYLRGRTLWLLGDSHSKQLYRALQCFLIDFWDHQECETSTDSSAVASLFNLPERSGYQKCLHLKGEGGGRICIVEVVLGTSFVGNSAIAKGGVLPLLRAKFAQPQDIFYVNFGVWHKKRPQWWDTLRPALEALGRDYQKNKAQWPHLLFRETPAEHPKDKDGNGKNCAPMRGYTFHAESGKLDIDEANRVNVKGWNSGLTANTAAQDILSRFGIPVVPAFASSVPLWDNHIGSVMSPETDCLHYCMPGLPQLWVYYMYDAFRSGKAQIKPIAGSRLAMESSHAKFTCIPNKIKFRRHLSGEEVVADN